MMHLATSIGDLTLAASAAWAWLSTNCEPAAMALVTSIWQGMVIVCGLEIALKLTPRISAAHRYAVWAAGFVVAAGLPWLPALHLSSHAAQAGAAAMAQSIAAPILEVDARWVVAIAALWAATSLWRAVSLMLHSVRLRQLWKAAVPVEINAALADALQDVRGGHVAVCTTEALDRPAVIGFLAPRILIPAWLIGRLTPSELEQIVLHEAEHLRRWDDWTNLAQKLALVLFPLNPALVWMEHRLCREREMACDEGVVQLTNAPRAYATCLARLAERRLERKAEALSLGAWQRRSELVHRVHRILRRKHRLSSPAAAVLLGTFGFALIAGSVEMAKCPQLVAFVPEQRSAAMTPERQREMAAMLAREDAEAKMTLPPGFRAMPAKAVITKPEHVSPSTPPNHPARKTPAVANKHVMEAEVAKPDVTGDRVNPSPENQWVVLAAWEEVQTVSQSSAAMTSDYAANTVAGTAAAETEPGNSTTGQAAAQSQHQNQTSSQYTVTRLILRVVPANRPATGLVRGGWFVIQL